MRRSRSRGPKRKLNWEHASIFFAAGALGGVNDLQAAWLRVPAGGYDPVQQRQIETNCTLVSTHVREDTRSSLLVAIIDAGVSSEMAIGICAWPSIYGDDTLPADVPDPTNGAFNWIWRNNHYVYRGLELVSTTDPVFDTRVERYDNQGADDLLQSRAQRKLPDNVGILCVWRAIDINVNILNESVQSTFMDVRMLVKNP